MTALDWMDKEKVIPNHCDVPFRVLERVRKRRELRVDVGQAALNTDSPIIESTSQVG